MRCPKCSTRISLFEVKKDFICKKCGTPLTSNSGVVVPITMFIALIGKGFFEHSYCRASNLVQVVPLPIVCNGLVMIGGIIAIGFLFLALFIRVKDG